MDSRKILFKYFFLFFLIAFLIFNWVEISWIFDPSYFLRALSFYFSEKSKNLLTSQEQGPKKETLQTEQQTENKKAAEETKELLPREQEIFEKEDSIEIPKIEIQAPLVLVSTEKEIKRALDRGVVLWPNSAFPGRPGQTIILGHSAPPNWPKIKYDWVFSNLNLLEKGDEVFVYFQKRKYVYEVEETIFLNRGQELPQTPPDQSFLFLISCWPPGRDVRRIAIKAILKK